MKEKIHFMETKQGYQLLTAEAYDENAVDVINEVVEEVDKNTLEQLLTKSWQEVREYIKTKVEEGLK